MVARGVCKRGHDLEAPSARLLPEKGRNLGACRKCSAARQREKRKATQPTSKRVWVQGPVPEGSKPCSVCHEVKPFDHFYRDKNRRNGIAGPCQTCAKAQRKRHYQANAEAHKLRVVAKRYGITEAQLIELREKQGDVCAICKGVNANGRALSVDHSHKIGTVRGLLCGACNFAIGLFQDHPELLVAAAEYLRTHHPEAVLGGRSGG